MAFFSLSALKGIFSFTKIVSKIKKSFRFVVEHWKECAIAALIGTVVYQNFFETEWLSWFGLRTVPGLEQEIEVKDKQLASCEASRERLKSEIEDTNQRVNRWYNLSQNLQQSHDNLSEKLGDMAEQREKATEQILNEPTPQTCQDAIRYLRNGAEELQW